MKRIILDVTLCVKSPFLFPEMAAGSFGIDRIALRNEDGCPIIPQEQVRGVLLHACADAALAMQKKHALRFSIFGQASADARPREGQKAQDTESFAPCRGRILFSDLVMQDATEEARAVRVQIDDELGAAKDGQLMFAELVAPTGADVTFAGQAVLMASDTEANEWLALLRAAASWVSAIGAMKSAGFGEVVSFSLAEKTRVPMAPARGTVRVGRQGYLLRFDRPFLVDARRAADNVYVGQAEVPGGVIKGALARKAELCGLADRLGPAISALAISHARLGGPVLPLSMVVSPDNQRVGDALSGLPGQGALIEDKPALWAPDWKPGTDDRVRAALGLEQAPMLRRSLRTHVAIEAGTAGAETGKLFVIDAVDPADRDWVFCVDYDRVLDEQARGLLAALLESGLDGLGRTGASATISPSVAPDLPKVVPIIGTQDQFAVVLESDAVMATPEDGEDAFDAYALWWARVLPGARLVTFAAQQRLAGGYLGRRYGPAGSYEPFWVTQAGSVFRLQGDLEQALTVLTEQGLPAPKIDGKPGTWQNCPYLPENGFGAIRCDHDGRLCSEVHHG